MAGKFLLATVAAVLAIIGGAACWLQATAPTRNTVRVVAIPAAAIAPRATPAPTPAPAAAVAPPSSTLPPVSEPVASGSMALVPAPDPELVEKSPDGPLPVISARGRQAWQAYARPFDRTDKRPRVSIVIYGLGLSKIATQDAIRILPPGVTLSFLPYYAIAEALQQARSFGHETLLDMPMEPLDYPRQDPGPRALLTLLDPHQNLDRLHWMMSRGAGYIGMMTYMGSRFAAAPELLRPILGELKQRGLAFVDARTTSEGAAFKLAAELKLPRALADRIVDTEPSSADIDQQLAQLEDLARRGGSAIGLGGAYPVTIQAVTAWAAHLGERGIALAPLSAVLVQ